MRRHHRISSASRGRRAAWRTRRPLRLRLVRASRAADPQELGLFGFGGHAARIIVRLRRNSAPTGWEKRALVRRSRSIGPSRSHPSGRSSSQRSERYARAVSSQLMRFTSTASRASTTARSCGRTRDLQRDEHDAGRRRRLPGARPPAETHAGSARVSTRGHQRRAPLRRRRHHRRFGRHHDDVTPVRTAAPFLRYARDDESAADLAMKRSKYALSSENASSGKMFATN